MKNYYLLLLTLLLTGLSFGQTTIYPQNFTNQNGKGAFGNELNLAGVDWTIDISQANLSNGVFGAWKDYFRVENGRFAARDTDGPAYWYSKIVTITGFNNVAFELDAYENGNSDNSANNRLETFKTHYRINGGPWIEAATNGYLDRNFTSAKVSTTGLSGNTIQIRVAIDNDAFLFDDHHSFDNIKITGICTTPNNVTGLGASTASQLVTLNWTNGLCFDEIMVVARQGNAVTAVPTGNGNAYTANAAFGSGTAIESNEFVVYKGAGTSANISSLTNGTTYHFRVYTRKGSVWSSGVPISATPESKYCSVTGNTGLGTALTLVNFGTINHQSGLDGGYSDNTAQITNAQRGSIMPLSIRVSTGGNYTVHAIAWIDWNQDGTFSATERYDLGDVRNSTSGSTSFSPLSITIPNTAVVGNTRMRIAARYFVDPEGPCVDISDGEIEDYTVKVTPAPITYTYNNGWSPSSPIGVATPIDMIVVVNGNAVLSGTTLSNMVTVEPTGALTVNPGALLSAVSGVHLKSSSTKYSSLILDGNIVGEVSYTRHVNGHLGVGKGRGNDLISAPVSGQTFGNFASENPNLRANPNTGMETQRLFGPFNKTTGAYSIWDTVAQASEELVAGVGYRAASTDNSGFTFTGVPNKDEVIHNIINSGPFFKAYNLVGNPYPSYLNVKSFLNYEVTPGVTNMDLMDEFGAIYGYDGDATGIAGSGWITYNLTTGVVGDDVNMTPGQGFLVTADVTKVAAYDMTFAPSMRRVGTTDDFIQGRPVNQNAAHIKLQAAIGTSLLKTDIFFIEGTTSGLDFGYDAAIYGRKAPAQALYSQLVENHTGVDLSIQSLAYSALESDITVPVGINVPQGQQVTVSIAETSLPENVEVYLEDTENGSFTLLNDTDYVFTSTSKLSNAGRFYLRFSAKTLSVEDNEVNGLRIFTTATPRALHIKGLLTATTTVTVYDLQGRLVVSSILDEGSQANKVDVSGLSVGAYIVKLSNASQQKTQKVILK